MRALCIGDIHLGRRPSRIPGDLPGVRPEDLTPAAAWRAAVDEAVSARVDAVLLAGDVVESNEDRMAAFGALEEGTRRLVEAGIRVVGVAGNHDDEALPRLARLIPGFRLLGKGGRWETVEVGRAGGVPVRVCGWSFPSRRWTQDPLAGLDGRAIEAGAGPVLGLLHCDLEGAAGSPYAPTSRTGLEALPLDAWLLGHVHAPDDLAHPRPVGYLGSLVGTSPRDQGPRGPWLLEVDGPGRVSMRHLPLAPLRYQSRAVPVDAIDTLGGAGVIEEGLEAALVEGLRGLERDLREGPRGPDGGAGEGIGRVRVVACRLTLEGRTADHLGLVRALEGLDWRELRHSGDAGTVLFIESVRDASAQSHDLERLAESRDPPALLARRLLDLEAMSPEGRRLVEEARARIEQEAGDRRRWGLLSPDSELPDLRELLVAQGRRALEELLAQKHRVLGPPASPPAGSPAGSSAASPARPPGGEA